METMPKSRLTSAAALIGATGLLLASCGDGGTDQEAAPSPDAGASQSAERSTVTVTETADEEQSAGIDVDFDSLQQEIGRAHV